MPKRAVIAKEILADIRAGMTDEALMKKYRISARQIEGLFGKLVERGFIKQEELEKRRVPPGPIVDMAWKCPSCGMPQEKEHEVCPQCGVIVGKFEERRKGEPWETTIVEEKESPAEEQSVAQEAEPESGEVGLGVGKPLPAEKKHKTRKWLLIYGIYVLIASVVVLGALLWLMVVLYPKLIGEVP